MTCSFLASTFRAVTILVLTTLAVSELGFMDRSVAQTPARTTQAQSAQKPSDPSPTPPAPPPPQPQRTEILNFDNWTVTCREFAEGKRKRICFALLQIVQANTNQAVFSWTIAYDEDNRLLGAFQTPTGISLTPGIELKLAKGTRTIAFSACETGHCVASFPIDAAFVKEIAATGSAEAVIRGSNGTSFQFNIPVKGFDKAFAALK